MLTRMTLGRLQPTVIDLPMLARISFGRLREFVVVSDVGDTAVAAVAEAANIGIGGAGGSQRSYYTPSERRKIDHYGWPDIKYGLIAPAKINAKRVAMGIFAQNRHDRIAGEIGVLTSEDGDGEDE